MTLDEVRDLIKYLLASYPMLRSRTSGDDAKALLAGWAPHFSHDDASAVRRAATRHVADSKYFPTVAELRASMDAERDLNRRAPALSAGSDVTTEEKIAWARDVVATLANAKKS